MIRPNSAVVVLCSILLVSCGTRLSGVSQEEFKASRALLEEELNASERERLEKALRAIVLYAASEKWNNSERHANRSIDQITLDVVDDKTFRDVIRFAETFLDRRNRERATQIEKEILALRERQRVAQRSKTWLEKLQTTDVEIVEGSWDTPALRARLVNTGAVVTIKSYALKLHLFSLRTQEKIDGVGTSQSFDPPKRIESGEPVAVMTRSLTSLLERSKRLSAQLKEPAYPISDVGRYDLKAVIRVDQITSSDGTVYTFPEKQPEDYEKEIAAAQAELNAVRELTGRLSEFELTDPKGEATQARADPYAEQLQTIRARAEAMASVDVEVVTGTRLAFPAHFDVQRKPPAGFYSLALGDNLVFSSDDEDFIQYQIIDTTYVEYAYERDKVQGVLNVLEKSDADYDLNEHVAAIRRSFRADESLIDADETGYLYRRGDTYHVLRYVRIEDTHHAYALRCPKLAQCVREFDRSKAMFH